MKRLIYLSLRAFSAIERYLRERLTPAGRVVFVTAGAGAIAGFDTNQTATYQAFTFLSALLVLALVTSLAGRRGLRVSVERELPRYLTAGESCSYRLHVVNRGRRTVTGATLLERFRDPRPSYAQWRATREPGEERRNWFDRNAGYFRWRWWIDRQLPAPQSAVALPALAPGARTSVRIALEPRRRGRIELAGMTLGRSDPLGLVQGLTSVEAPARLIALPRRYRLPALALPGARRFQQGGVSLSTSVGDSEEFVSLRDYRPGDPLQKLHWKSFARTGRPIVKEYQDEFFERHALVLDSCHDGGEDAAFEAAVALAASFVYTIDTQECLLDLLFVAGEVQRYTAGRGQMQPAGMLEILAGVAPSPHGAFDPLAQAVLARRGQLSSCILVLLAWDEPRRVLARTLAASGMALRLMLVCEPAATPRDAPHGLLVLHPGRIEEGLARLG